MNRNKIIPQAVQSFARDTRAVISAELVLVLPMLCWAFFATLVFTDAYRARAQAQAAALHVSDLISRQTISLTEDYLDGMNDVYDFLIAGRQTSRLRITSVVWDRDANEPQVLWSHGTRGMRPLPDNAFQLLAAGDLPTLRTLMDGEDGADLIAGFTQMPVEDLHLRIPPVMPGEALILVESFTMWETPVRGLFLGFDILDDTRFSPIAVVRPRFAPFVNFEGAAGVVPPDFGDFEPGAEIGEGGGSGEPEGEYPPEPEEPGNPLTIVATDFSNTSDADGWSSPTVSTSGNAVIGSYLGPFGQETRNNPVTYSVDFGQRISRATMEVDLVLFDSWDGFNSRWAPPEGEGLMISINGETVAFEVFDVSGDGFYRRTRRMVANTAHGQFEIAFELQTNGSNLIAGGWNDQVWKMTVTATDPAQRLTLGFAMNANEPASNESFAISGLRVSTVPGAHSPGRFVPDQNALLERDPLTGFSLYDGCPDPRHAARSLLVRSRDLAALGTLRHRVRAGGRTYMPYCPGIARNEEGYVNASPSVILQWDNEDRRGSGNYLRIRTDDGNSGFDCDSVLLVRDPNGQIMYNGWIRWRNRNDDDWNAVLDMNNAQSGTYTIWVGQWTSGYCDTSFELSLF